MTYGMFIMEKQFVQVIGISGIHIEMKTLRTESQRKKNIMIMMKTEDGLQCLLRMNQRMSMFMINIILQGLREAENILVRMK